MGGYYYDMLYTYSVIMSHDNYQKMSTIHALFKKQYSDAKNLSS